MRKASFTPKCDVAQRVLAQFRWSNDILGLWVEGAATGGFQRPEQRLKEQRKRKRIGFARRQQRERHFETHILELLTLSAGEKMKNIDFHFPIYLYKNMRCIFRC